MVVPENHPVRLKLQNLISSPAIIQPQVADALNIIAENYDLKQTGTRKALPELLNAKRINLFTEFMTTFQSIVTEVEAVETQFAGLKKQYIDMNIKWQGIKSSTKTLFKDSLDLHHKKRELEERAKESEQFYRDYSLTEDEMLVLEAATISAEFFDALEKIHVMRRKVEALASNASATTPVTPGFKSSDSMRSSVFALLSDYEEVAVEKLYQWLQSVIKVNMAVESPELSPLVFKAFGTLSDREILWQSCMEEMCYQRKSVTAKAFMEALIKGGPNGNPKPIEFHAYDPVRYVGDIFAWIHQLCASEYEMLTAIFKSDSDSVKEDSVLKQSVDKHTDGISKILEARISQIFQTPRPLLVLFRINHLILFYSHVFEKFLLSDSTLIQCIKG